VKRVLDFTIALIALMVLSPVMIVVALMVWLSDGRSPWYRGVRIGRGGVEFRMLKFRTMRVGAAASGVNSTAAGDARITPVGRGLRRGKLDELPQLINVLLGEMSLVGPRPQVPCDVQLYTTAETRMLDVRPGITDLASIVFADEGAILTDADDPDVLYNQIIRPWKSRLALAYIVRASVLLDMRIVMLTAMALVSRRRALDQVERILLEWDADPLLIRMAARREELRAYPPPGASEVVENYPARAAHV
jgi:lipopolysaccharide/colanic/teichoic acid biosynthesis glycosyltransferase